MTQIKVDSGDVEIVERPDPRRPGQVAVIAGLVAAAWVLPLITHLLRVDVLLLPAIILGTAALLRAGGTLLDRIMLAIGLDAGLAIVAGLVFSVWPWGFDPIAVAGCALTLLVVAGVVTGRRPVLPRRMLGSDLVLLAGAACGGLVAGWPTLRSGPTQSLAYSSINGDRMRHVNLFDTIRRMGGYTFLDFDKAKPMVEAALGKNYPSGMHYLYALVDTFVTSGSEASGLSELSRYYAYVVCGFAFFVLSVAWAARWAAGPALAGWRRSFLCAALAGWVGTGVMATLVWEAFDPEVLGLAFLALLIAVLARPAHRIGEELLLVSALLVATVFIYTLFAMAAGVAVIVSAAVYRQRMLRHWKLTLAVAVVTLPLALTQVIIPKLYGFSGTNQLLQPGFVVPVPRRILLVLGVLALAGAAGRRALRTPSRQALLAIVVLNGVAVLGLWAYQHATIGGTAYYFEKSVHAFAVVCLIATGPVLLLVKRSNPAAAAHQVWWRRALPGAAATAAALLLVGAVPWGKTTFYRPDLALGPDTNWAQVWMSGRQIWGPHAKAVATLNRHGLIADGKPSLVVFDTFGQPNVHATLMLATFNHDLGLINKQVYGMDKAHDLVNVPKPKHPGDRLPKETEAGLRELEKNIASSPVPLRVILSDPTVADRLRAWGDQHPQYRLTVRLLRDLPPQSFPW